MSWGMVVFCGEGNHWRPLHTGAWHHIKRGTLNDSEVAALNTAYHDHNYIHLHNVTSPNVIMDVKRSLFFVFVPKDP